MTAPRIHDRCSRWCSSASAASGESRLPMVISDGKATAELVRDMAGRIPGEEICVSVVCWISPQAATSWRVTSSDFVPGRAEATSVTGSATRPTSSQARAIQLMSELVDELGDRRRGFLPPLHPWRGCALPQRGGTDGDRHAPVYVRRSRSARLHPSASIPWPRIARPGPCRLRDDAARSSRAIPSQTAYRSSTPGCAGACCR